MYAWPYLPILSGDLSWASVSEASCSLALLAAAAAVEDVDAAEGGSILLWKERVTYLAALVAANQPPRDQQQALPAALTRMSLDYTLALLATH